REARLAPPSSRGSAAGYRTAITGPSNIWLPRADRGALEQLAVGRLEDADDHILQILLGVRGHRVIEKVFRRRRYGLEQGQLIHGRVFHTAVDGVPRGRGNLVPGDERQILRRRALHARGRDDALQDRDVVHLGRGDDARVATGHGDPKRGGI